MDGKIYYQVILINPEDNTYAAARLWDGSIASKHRTLWEAEADMTDWAEWLGKSSEHLHLGVQEVRSTPMPGHKPVADYKQGE